MTGMRVIYPHKKKVAKKVLDPATSPMLKFDEDQRAPFTTETLVYEPETKERRRRRSRKMTEEVETMADGTGKPFPPEAPEAPEGPHTPGGTPDDL